jgi:hypothetical protein
MSKQASDILEAFETREIMLNTLMQRIEDVGL